MFENIKHMVTWACTDKNVVFPSGVWVRMPDEPQIPTTTSGAEADHKHFKKCC